MLNSAISRELSYMGHAHAPPVLTGEHLVPKDSRQHKKVVRKEAHMIYTNHTTKPDKWQLLGVAPH